MQRLCISHLFSTYIGRNFSTGWPDFHGGGLRNTGGILIYEQYFY